MTNERSGILPGRDLGASENRMAEITCTLHIHPDAYLDVILD